MQSSGANNRSCNRRGTVGKTLRYRGLWGKGHLQELGPSIKDTANLQQSYKERAGRANTLTSLSSHPQFACRGSSWSNPMGSPGAKKSLMQSRQVCPPDTEKAKEVDLKEQTRALQNEWKDFINKTLKAQIIKEKIYTLNIQQIY